MNQAKGQYSSVAINILPICVIIIIDLLHFVHDDGRMWFCITLYGIRVDCHICWRKLAMTGWSKNNKFFGFTDVITQKMVCFCTISKGGFPPLLVFTVNVL
jgi:hypothetical protein